MNDCTRLVMSNCLVIIFQLIKVCFLLDHCLVLLCYCSLIVTCFVNVGIADYFSGHKTEYCFCFLKLASINLASSLIRKLLIIEK